MNGRRLLKAVIFLTLLPLLGACGGVLAESQTTEEPPLLGTLTLSRSGCSLDLLEDTAGPGTYAIDVANDTGTPGATFDMWTILPGQTYEGFAEQIEKARLMTESEQELTLASLPPPRGVADWRRFGIGAGSETVYKYLTPGTYAIVCQELIEPAGFWPMYTAGPIEIE